MTATATLANLPTDRDELWRYTPVDEVVARVERSVSAPGDVATSVPPSLVDALTGATGPRFVFVNGRHAAVHSDRDDLAVGVCCRVSDASDVDGAGTATVTVDDGVRIDEPIHIVHLTVPDAEDAHSVLSRVRTVIDVGTDARVAIVETYGTVDGATVSDTETTIRVGDHAELDHYRIQIEGPAATHIGRTRIDQATGSVVRMTSVTLGGDVSRNAIDVHLDAPSARAELAGIDMAGGRQRHDTVVTVDHAASQCSSSQRFTGVVDQHGRSSFSGEIIVRPGTTATDAHQSTRNLVLHPSAEADARPWLRIHADDVRCTHGATVGRLDDDALHYLRSRGIALPRARAMLINAFLRDITDTMAHESVRTHVAALVASATSGSPSVATADAVEQERP